MTILVEVNGDDAAELSREGKELCLVSTVAFPPGAPLVVVLRADRGTLRANAKSFGARRREDGRYASRVRFVSLRREERVEIDSMLDRVLGSAPE